MHKSNRYLHYFIIALTGILIFLPGMFSFFNSDDFVWLRNSQKISFGSVSHFAVNYNPILKFRPFTHLLFQFLYAIFQLNPLSYHIASLFLHIINALIFYTLLYKFTSESKLSLFASLIFVTHFAQEESLFWISALSSPLVTFFYLSSIWSLWKYLEKQRIGLYLLSFLLSVLAILSKEDGTTIFLAVFFLVLLRSSGEFSVRIRKGIVLSIPFLLLTGVYAVIRYMTVPPDIMSKFLTHNPVVIIKNICYFGISLLFPVRPFFDLIGFKVHAYLNNTIQVKFNNPWFILVVTLICSAFVFAVLYFLRKKIRAFSLGLGLLVVGILPYLLVNGNGQRFLYFPSLGFSLALAGLLIYLFERIKKVKLLNMTMVLFLIFNGAVLFERSVWWRKAGEVCREVIAGAGKIVMSAPENSDVYFEDLPRRLNGAYIFHVGLEQALSLFYPQAKARAYDFAQLTDEEVLALKSHYAGSFYTWKGKGFEKVYPK